MVSSRLPWSREVQAQSKHIARELGDVPDAALRFPVVSSYRAHIEEDTKEQTSSQSTTQEGKSQLGQR